jgi:hypothetical protein
LDEKIKTLPNTKNKTKKASLELHLAEYLKNINSKQNISYLLNKILM